MSEQPSIEPLKEWNTFYPTDVSTRAIAAYDNMSSEINELKLQNHGLKLVNDATSTQLTSLRAQVAALTKERDEARSSYEAAFDCKEHLMEKYNATLDRLHALEQGVACASELINQVHIVNDEPFPNQGVRVSIPDWFEKRRHVLDKISSQST